MEGGRLLDTGRLLEGASNKNFTPKGGRLLDTGNLFESVRLLDHLQYMITERSAIELSRTFDF